MTSDAGAVEEVIDTGLSQDRPIDLAPYAVGFPRRLLAAVVDGTLILVLGVVTGAVSTRDPRPIVLLAPLYLVLSWSHWGQGRTVGLWLVRAAVVTRNNTELTLGRAVFRLVAVLLALAPLGLGLAWIAADKHRQGWHDHLAGTWVVNA